MTEARSKPIRSPSYPAMPLQAAVEAVGKIESTYRSAAVDRTAAARLIGYSSLSGPANKALAALASYGLLERAGKGEARVTGRARAILHANDEQERRDNLLAAASEPDLYREIKERFEGIPIPPMDGVITYLNRQGFNPTAVRPAAKAFLETMMYVESLGGSESHTPQSTNERESELPDDKKVIYGGARVGDLIQWESGGVLQLPKPLRVRSVSDNGEWVAVDGSRTGIPMSEVIVETPAPRQMPIFEFDEPEDKKPSRGETQFAQVPVGKGKQVVLSCIGGEDLSPREYGILIRALEAYKEGLEATDED